MQRLANGIEHLCEKFSNEGSQHMRRFLLFALRHAALVDEFVLPDDAEPAPVFHA